MNNNQLLNNIILNRFPYIHNSEDMKKYEHIIKLDEIIDTLHVIWEVINQSFPIYKSVLMNNLPIFRGRYHLYYLMNNVYHLHILIMEENIIILIENEYDKIFKYTILDLLYIIDDDSWTQKQIFKLL